MWFWLPLAALAQEVPSATALCADAIEGTEIELCMRLAADFPEEVDGVSAALRALVDIGSEPDRELLAALLLLLSEHRGAEGAERLGELADPRAVEPLVYVAETRSTDVAVAAVQALTNYPSALEPLTRWLTDAELDEAVRIAAARALGRRGDIEGADALLSALRRRDLPPELRNACTSVIRESFSSRINEIVDVPPPGAAGWISAGGAIGLGSSLALAARFASPELTWLGGSAGAVAGGTGGYLLGRAAPIAPGDAALTTTSGVMGAVSGGLIGAAVTQGASNRINGATLGGLAGEAVGFSAGALVLRRWDGDPIDAIEASAFAGATALVAGSAVDFVLVPDREVRDDFRVRPGLLAAGVGLAAGEVAGLLLAPRVDVTNADPGLIALSSASGLALGALVPTRNRRQRALPLAGLSVGALSGYALSAAFDPKPRTVIAATTGALYGAGLGVGVGRLADPWSKRGSDGIQVAALIGAAGGLGVGALATRDDTSPLEPSDVAFVGLVTGWSAWQAAALHAYDRPPPVTADGWYWILPATAGIGAAAASDRLDVPTSVTFSGLAAGMWGGFLGGTTARLTDRDVLLGTLIGSDLGLVTGVALAIPPVSAPPVVFALGDAGGIVGGTAAVLTVRMVTDNDRAILGATLGGAGVGFVGGALLGRQLSRRGATQDFANLRYRLPEVPGQVVFSPTVLPGDDGPVMGATVGVVGW